MICYNCKGNGYVKLKFEGETAIHQCKVCYSQGETKEDEYYPQSWDDGNGNPCIYHGPPLEPDGFKNYKIYPIPSDSNI
jgi:hypothetical protein